MRDRYYDGSGAIKQDEWDKDSRAWIQYKETAVKANVELKAEIVRLPKRAEEANAVLDKVAGAEKGLRQELAKGMKEDVSAALAGTKWRETDKDGKYTNYEFREEGGEYKWFSEWFFKDGGQVSSNRSGGTYSAVKSASGTFVTIKYWSSALREFEWRGNELISKEGSILKRR